MIRTAVFAALACVMLQAVGGCGSMVETSPGSTGGAISTSGSQGGATSNATTGAGGHGGGGGGGGGGSSTTGCGAGETLCGTVCASADDPSYGCGSASCTPCDVPNATPVCMGGGCVTGTCNPGYADCDGIDLPADGCLNSVDTDPNNCGQCGNLCPTPANGAPTCSDGACGVTCNAGFADCGGVCADEGTDPNNCGACGMRCAAGLPCVEGVCTLVCPEGTANCPGDPPDACATQLGTDANCASCGDSCVGPNMLLTCEGAGNTFMCVGSCQPGFANCNGGSFCDVNTVTDADNCGFCGNVCPSGPRSTPVCVNGGCALNCTPGWANCDGNAAEGCEVDTQTDANNCGACGTMCVSGQTCSAGACH